MSGQYDIYCLVDRLFYDKPDGRSAESDFRACGNPVPDGWDHSPSDSWMHYAPKERDLPSQGWKVHVSACLEDSERVVDMVWDYCLQRGVAFKFLRNKSVMLMFNSKAAFRGSSGKLVTLYPVDVDQLQRILTELDERLAGVRGPYILSDLRHREGPLYVRYGGFAERYCLSDGGERVLALEDAEGRLVPDVRGPTFAIPPWIQLPAFLEADLAARNSVTVDGLPYDIEGVLQFSNGGGVYLGRDRRTEQRVVLKEGRPYAGLDTDGRDAVTRIQHERDILERLSGLDEVPAMIDYFTLGDHHFLVQEFVDGNPLQRLLVHRFPLSHPDYDQHSVEEYREWALRMLTKVERAVEALHERGVVFGDLHPENILVTADERLVLIDFEVSSLAEDRARSALAHPAFQAPADRLGVDSDLYALACLCIYMFAPQTTVMLPLHPDKARQLVDMAREIFDVPQDRIGRALRTISGTGKEKPPVSDTPPVPGIDSWDEVRSALSTAVLASATPDRDDRLFPGDVDQFQPGGGLNFATGAAGVLYALAATDCERRPEYEDWLRKRVLDTERDMRPGFFTGRHGIAYVLDTLGYRQEALDAIAASLSQDVDELGLYSGLAGIGLNLLHFAELTGDSDFARLAERIVDLTAERMGGPTDVPETSGGDHPRAGLMYGSSGCALLFLNAYERSGDRALLDHASVALQQDLRRCIRNDDGSLQVNQGWRTLPYLDEGSVGIGLVLERYLQHREDADLAEALPALQSVTRCGFSVQSGLFAGRSSMIAGHGMAIRRDAPDTGLLSGLRWHALPYAGGLAFPGNQLLRLSMDFATGTAGVLFALGTVLQDRRICLPFLTTTPPRSERRPEGIEGGCRHGSS